MSDDIKVQEHPSGCGCTIVSQPGREVEVRGHGGALLWAVDPRGTSTPWLPGALAAAIEHARTGDFDDR